MNSPVQQNSINSLLAIIDTEQTMQGLGGRLDTACSLYGGQLTPELAKPTIYGFLVEYISTSPKMMDILGKLGKQYRMQALIDPYIQIAANYLNSACLELELELKQALEQRLEKNTTDAKTEGGTTDGPRQLLILLQGSYIFHRMIEELDDRIQHFIGVPLTHIDMMNANLIAHDVIGDKFANRLDQMIETMFQRSKITKAVIEAQLDKHQIDLFREAGRALSGEKVICLAGTRKLSLF